MSNIPKSARYDPSGLLGSPSPVNIVVGARSLGKTYGFTKRGIRNFIERGEHWVYLRRYDTEVNDSKLAGTNGFFSHIMANGEFPGWEFKNDGPRMMARREADIEGKADKWQIMGYIMALSRAQSYKGLNLAHVTMMVYDEFILERKVPPYLKNEPDVLMNLWETIDRRNDVVRVYLLANAAGITNPYFIQWGLQLPVKGKTKTYKHRESSITIQYADDAKFKAYASKSNIGAFTSGTSYESYALDNEFIGVNDEFLADKTPEAVYQYTLVMKGIDYSIWVDHKSGEWYINRKSINDDRFTYTLIRDDLKPNTFMLERSNVILKSLKQAIQYNFVSYDTIQTKQTFLDSMELLGIR